MKRTLAWVGGVSLVLTLILSIQRTGRAALQFSPGAGWNEVEQFWSVTDASWTLSSDERVFASVMSHSKSEMATQITDRGVDSFLKEFTRGRSAVMSLQGITDWAIKSHQITVKGSLKTLTMTGGYTDVAGETVRFHEVHFFDENRYRVFQLIWPEESDFGKSGGERALTEKFMKEGSV